MSCVATTSEAFCKRRQRRLRAHLQRDKHGVAHVERARHVRRRHGDDKRLAVAGRAEEASLLPPGAFAGGGGCVRGAASSAGEALLRRRTTGTAVPPWPGGRSSWPAPRRACPERRRLRARGGQIRGGGRGASHPGVPEAPAPDADAAARTRARVGTGSAARTQRPRGGRDTRQHQGGKPAAAPGAAATVRSALPAMQLGVRADAKRAGTAAQAAVDKRVLLSITPGRRRHAKLRTAAAVAVVAGEPPRRAHATVKERSSRVRADVAASCGSFASRTLPLTQAAFCRPTDVTRGRAAQSNAR